MPIEKKGNWCMKKKKVSRIPKFKSLDEEARFWDTHSFADYWDEFKDVNMVVNLQKPKEETMILRVQKNLKNKIEKIAKKRGLSVSSLIRIWLTQKLQTS